MLKLVLVLHILLVMPFVLADELRLHVIRPPKRIDWSSPRSLARTSALNSISKDYAPIGHFAVEVNCTKPNRFGVSHVLTGMERKDKSKVQKMIRQKRLGLGSLIYNFEGRLQTRDLVINELTLAKTDNRLNTIIIPTSSENCEAMMNFLDSWIENGSYEVYGGNKKVEQGEGAGCADFARMFFEIATGEEMPRKWIASVVVPKKLMGNHHHRVTLTSLLLRGEWAKPDEESFLFEIPDADLVSDWIESQRTFKNNVVEYPTAELNSFSSLLSNFTFSYSTQIKSEELWSKIKIQ